MGVHTLKLSLSKICKKEYRQIFCRTKYTKRATKQNNNKNILPPCLLHTRVCIWFQFWAEKSRRPTLSLSFPYKPCPQPIKMPSTNQNVPCRLKSCPQPLKMSLFRSARTSCTTSAGPVRSQAKSESLV